jgi:hypothetical protein
LKNRSGAVLSLRAVVGAIDAGIDDGIDPHDLFLDFEQRYTDKLRKSNSAIGQHLEAGAFIRAGSR